MTVGRSRSGAVALLLAGTVLGLVPAHAGPATSGMRLRAACGPTRPGTARCLAVVALGGAGQPVAANTGTAQAAGPADGSAANSGYRPVDLQAAYRLPSMTAGAGQTVAVVDAFDDPHAEADMAAYRAAFGLTPCTAASGCFRKVNQDGGAALPAPDSGWGLEESLDLDMVSAACPRCHIVLVEASDTGDLTLATGVDTAVRLGAVAVSASFGDVESANERSVLDPHFHHPGVAITAAAGDSGYGVEYPAASAFVTAVGGTTLSRASGGRGWSETVWPGTGSGCSTYEPKPAWQHDGACSHRMVADVAAVGDPATGVAVYDTFAQQVGDPTGWIEVGGTSVGAPLVASAYALAGDSRGVALPVALAYARPGLLNDVRAGNNQPSAVDASAYTLSYAASGQILSAGAGNAPLVQQVLSPCPGGYFCNARAGYDGPTGLGTPAGIGAF